MNKEKLWTKDFIVVSLINFVITLVFYLLIVIMASYSMQEFHVSTSMAGLVSGIFIIGSLIGRLFTGRVIQNVGSKKTILVGLVFFIITTGLYLVAKNLPLLIANRLFHGIAVGIVGTATGTIIAQIIPPNRRGEGVGYFSMSAILATAIGPFMGIFFIEHSSYSMIFLFNLLLAVITLFISFTVKVPVQQPSRNHLKNNSNSFSISKFIEPKAVPISIVALVIGFSYSGVMSYLSFYSKEIQLVEAGSYFFLVYAVMILLSRPFTGKLMDAKGANIVVYPCLVIFAIGMLLFSQAHSGIILLTASALIGLGYGNFNSIAQAVAIKVTPTERLGLATSTYFIFYDLGLGAGPYLLGFFEPILGYRGLFLVMVLVIVISIGLYHILYGNKERALNQSNMNHVMKL